MGLFSTKKILYTPGPLAAARLPGVGAAARELLRDLGVEVVELELWSGYEAWFAGRESDFADLLARNRERLKREGVGLIVTSDPHEAYTFRERYGLEARHIVELLAEHVAKLRKGEERRAAYHHPCFLDRLGVSPTTVRNVLRRAGIHVPAGNRDRGCCGSVGHDFERNNKEEARAIAAARRQRLGDRIITCCPHCQLILAGKGVKVEDVCQALLEATQ